MRGETPKWINVVNIDRTVDVTLKEAIDGVIEVAKREGLYVGLSSGAVYSAYKKMSHNSGVYVLIFPDDVFKYIGTLSQYVQTGNK